MHGKLSGWGDTIAAIATPPGVGAIGVLRVSGESAFEIVSKLFPSKNIAQQPANTLHVGYIKEGKETLDEVVVSIFKRPSSYTGEDVVEISCHGSSYVQQRVLNAIISNGARLAKPGEFTQRAFLNGKLDLTEAEAVADLILSNTSASQNAALKNMRGGFSEVLKDLRARLIQFAALIELELDFSEEDVEFADMQKFSELLNELESTINNLLESFQLGNVIKNGVSVAIIGSPNAGKSTLLNTLLNDNRAIVSEIAGTTRDTIEEIININGILFRLIDTAGIRENSSDIIENMGVLKSKEKIKQADIVLYLYDLNTTTNKNISSIITDLKNENGNVVPVANKIDTTDKSFLLQQKDFLKDHIFVSAKLKAGIDGLREKLFVMATGDKLLTENIIVTNARHHSALIEVMKSLKEIRIGIDKKISGDFLAVDIRRCLHYLGEITGEITNEDLLDHIFSKFCIGK